MSGDSTEKQKWHGILREEIAWFPKVDCCCTI